MLVLDCVNLVEQMYSQSIQIMLEKSKPIREGLRKKYNQPKWWEWFEYLHDEMKKRELKQTRKCALARLGKLLLKGSIAGDNGSFEASAKAQN